MRTIHAGNTTAGMRVGDEAHPVIAIADLRFAWATASAHVLALDWFTVERGELLLIMGPSGSGKSTLLGLMSGILQPHQGEVRVLGALLSDLNGAERDRFRADNTGYIFQLFNLIPYLSIIENVLLPCRFSISRKNRALAHAASLHEEALRLLKSLKLDDPGLLRKPVVELSIGQQQRVAAARALIGSPEVIIADEPTSSLDTDHREAFLRLLFDECAKSRATLIFVSHDRSLARLFDRVVSLPEINSARPDTQQEMV